MFCNFNNLHSLKFKKAQFDLLTHLLIIINELHFIIHLHRYKQRVETCYTCDCTIDEFWPEVMKIAVKFSCFPRKKTPLYLEWNG